MNCGPMLFLILNMGNARSYSTLKQTREAMLSV
jgi:hypothetical protein